MAVFHLWEAMEKHGKNIHPLDEILNNQGV
jgi:hypothetical protein